MCCVQLACRVDSFPRVQPSDPHRVPTRPSSGRILTDVIPRSILVCLPPPFSRHVALTLITRLLLLICSSSCTHISCNRPDLVRFCEQCYVLHFCVVYALFSSSSCCRTAVQNNLGVCTCGPTKVAGLLPERHATLVIVITVDA